MLRKVGMISLPKKIHVMKCIMDLLKWFMLDKKKWSRQTAQNQMQSDYLLTLKAPITTAADDNFFMRWSRKFVRGGPTLTTFFSLMRGGRLKIPLLAGHHRPASETPFNVPTLNAGLEALWFLRGSGTVLLRNPIFLSPSGSAHKFLQHLSQFGKKIRHYISWELSALMKYHALFVIFEKAANFDIVVCCKLWVNLTSIL